jgi:hypothetical protein
MVVKAKAIGRESKSTLYRGVMKTREMKGMQKGRRISFRVMVGEFFLGSAFKLIAQIFLTGVARWSINGRDHLHVFKYMNIPARKLLVALICN